MTAQRGWVDAKGPSEVQGDHVWKGAAGLRAERGRERRRLRFAALVAVLFLYGLLQVRLGTEAAARGSRITGLRQELKKTEVDLTVAKARLASRQIYGALMIPAEESGFGPGGQHRTIALRVSAPVAGNRLVDQVRAELSAGASMLLPQALAQELKAGDPATRARRP
jgi:hypothetical protein